MKGKDRRIRLMKDLSRTWTVQRLKHISLSAVPIWLSPNVSSASRYQHSLGVGRLSLSVSDGAEDDQLLLTAAAVLHDVGDGPFPHISDQVMEEVLGFKHEGGVRFAFENSPVKDSSVLEKYGLDLWEIASIVKGEHRLSHFLHGRPDLDNADNVYRFITTMPRRLLGEASYNPLEIAANLSMKNGEQKLPEDLREKWLRDWETVYSHVWEDRLNMVGWTMLGRAMRLLKEELTPRFFLTTNREAFRLIELKIPNLAGGLRMRKFKIVLDRKYSQLRGEARKFMNPTNVRRIEDELCRATGLEDWSLGLSVDQPLIREKVDHWRVYLAVYNGSEEPKFLLEDILSASIPFSIGD